MSDKLNFQNNQEVLFEVISSETTCTKLGIITLNRPKALNALSYTMIDNITKHLVNWRNDNSINAVIIKSSCEKAFCAGGDIKSLHDNGKEDPKKCMEFFYHEYRLNTLIKHYPKPYIALINGITMGGGIGVSLHGSHIVATNDLKLAMPESSIGFFTDVGASYFLSRCPDYTGMYLGLTGDRINSSDAKKISLVTHCVNNASNPNIFQDIISELLNIELNRAESNQELSSIINDTLEQFCDKFDNTNTFNSKLLDNLENIKSCFSAASVELILNNLKDLASNPSNSSIDKSADWAEKTLSVLNTKSPTSLVIIFELLKRGSELEFSQCMQMEYGVAYGFLTNNDLYEGIRALLIDKDNKPDWDNVCLNNIKDFNFKHYFNNEFSTSLDFI